MVRTAVWFGLVLTLGASAAMAQDPVGKLQDLVGAKGGAAETELESRGYDFVRTEKTGDSAYSYWREQHSRRCVTIRTSDGRYQSIVYAPESDCAGGGTDSTLAASAGEGSFASVCGVVSDGQEHRYKCRLKIEGCKGEGYCRTIVTYPDMEMKLTWKKENHVLVEVTGLNPQETTSTFDQGLTKFTFYDQMYFFYGTQERAEKEAAKFHG